MKYKTGFLNISSTKEDHRIELIHLSAKLDKTKILLDKREDLITLGLSNEKYTFASHTLFKDIAFTLEEYPDLYFIINNKIWSTEFLKFLKKNNSIAYNKIKIIIT